MKAKSICLVGLLSVPALCSAWEPNLITVNTTFKTRSVSEERKVTYEVDTTGARVMDPVFVFQPSPFPFSNEGPFLGYFGKFHTTDSGEEEVELKVFDESGTSVFLYGVVLPPAPTEFYAKWSPKEPEEEEYEHVTDPIMVVLGDFMKSTAPQSVYEQPSETERRIAQKLAEYDERIKNKDYEACICSALTRLTSLGHNSSVMDLASRFGFAVLDKEGIINFTRRQTENLDKLIREDTDIDKTCEVALPVLKAALADLEKVPMEWTGMEVSKEAGYSVDEPIYCDYADTLLVRAAISEMISALYLLKGYNTLTPDKQPKDIDLEALAEAQRWMQAAAVQVNAFVSAAYERPYAEYPYRLYFFMLIWGDAGPLRDILKDLANVPYWTVRFDPMALGKFFFLTDFVDRNAVKAKREKKEEDYRAYTKELDARKKAKREILMFMGPLDVSFRSLFEGKVRTADGTFPQFLQALPLLDTLSDSTLAGTFPGMSRTQLGKYLDLFGKVEPYEASDEVKEYAVFYNLKGAKNNPKNPATFAAGLESDIALLPPTREGYRFTGWSNGGVIPAGTAKALTFTATFEQLPPEGGEGNPWKIGTTADDTVVAWTNGTTLVVEGKGKMKDFTAESPVPWAKGDIVLATVGSDVASLGNAAFADSPTGEGAEIVFKNPAAVINIGAFVGDGGAKTNVPAVKVETVAKDGQVRRIVPVGYRDVADRRKVYPTLQAAIDAGASAVTPRIRSDVVIVFH